MRWGDVFLFESRITRIFLSESGFTGLEDFQDSVAVRSRDLVDNSSESRIARILDAFLQEVSFLVGWVERILKKRRGFL